MEYCYQQNLHNLDHQYCKKDHICKSLINSGQELNLELHQTKFQYKNYMKNLS